MSEQEIDSKVRDFFQSLMKKAKSDEEVGKCVDKAVDYYFELKAQSKQLHFVFAEDEE